MADVAKSRGLAALEMTRRAVDTPIIVPAWGSTCYAQRFNSSLDGSRSRPDRSCLSDGQIQTPFNLQDRLTARGGLPPSGKHRNFAGHS
jgi:hypothetical protein